MLLCFETDSVCIIQLCNCGFNKVPRQKAAIFRQTRFRLWVFICAQIFQNVKFPISRRKLKEDFLPKIKFFDRLLSKGKGGNRPLCHDGNSRYTKLQTRSGVGVGTVPVSSTEAVCWRRRSSGGLRRSGLGAVSSRPRRLKRRLLTVPGRQRWTKRKLTKNLLANSLTNLF